MLNTGTIYGINGPVIYLKGNTGFRMSEMVYVGKQKLVGEVIALDKDRTTIQVYEETTGLRPGEEVVASGNAVSVTLAPGILNNIFDGIERPLERIAETGGAFITRGVSVDSLDREKKWKTHIVVEKGQYLHGGDIIAEVPETHAILHKCMIPPDVEGTVKEVVKDGEYTIDETLVILELPDGGEKKLTMTQRWPIRVPRPTHHRFPASVPLVTGQRIIDTMFPIAKGGTAAIPGGFGTGKTMTQHQIAKWADADIIIYIGCGERGNEMTDVLNEFPELKDPKTGKPLMERVVTVSGDDIQNPGNFRVPIGMNHRELVDAAGGFITEPQKLISGGPMMGFAMVTLDAPVTKTSSSILAFQKDEAAEAKETACINCGRCVEVCPSRIIPSRLADLSERHNEEGFVKMNGLECVECGSCSFVCPAKRNLKQAIGSMRKIALANKRK